MEHVHVTEAVWWCAGQEHAVVLTATELHSHAKEEISGMLLCHAVSVCTKLLVFLCTVILNCCWLEFDLRHSWTHKLKPCLPYLCFMQCDSPHLPMQCMLLG